MPSGPYERFYPAEDRGLVDPTWGGGAHRLSAPSVSQHGGTIGLLTAGAGAGLGLYRLGLLGYQGIEKGGQALDRILPALKSIAKKGIPVWGEGVLDYGADKQTEKEVEKVIEKVKERREPVSRLKTGRVPQLGSSNLTSASWYSRAEDAVLNADQEKGDAGYWKNRIGEAGGRKELGMTGGDVVFDTLKKTKGSMSKSEVLSLLSPHTVRLEETYLTSPERAAGVFDEPVYADSSNLNLQGYNKGNPVEILLRLPEKSWSYTNPHSNFDDRDWPNALNVLVHIRGNDGKLFNLPAFIIQEIQSNWHQKGQAEGYRQPLMMTPDDMELKRVSVEEAFHYGQSRVEDDIQWRQTTSPWWEMVDFQDWQEHNNLPEGTPVTLYRMKGSDKWELAPEPDITLDDLWNREFDYYSGGETRPNDAFYDAFEASSNNRVPDAPYKKTWHELGFKRALMEALRDPNKEYLAWTTGEAQAERAHGENWEVDFPRSSQFHLKLYNEKIVRFAKKFLGVEPQREKPRGWSVYIPQTREEVAFFDTEREAERYAVKRSQHNIDTNSGEGLLDYDQTDSNLWYIKISEEMRDRFIKVLEDELGAPPEVQMPTAQIEGGGLLGRYA